MIYKEATLDVLVRQQIQLRPNNFETQDLNSYLKENKEQILSICNRIIENEDFNDIHFIEYIRILIQHPEYDLFTERLFKKIDIILVINEFYLFLQRNPGNLLLNKISVPELIKRNDEISWSIIARLIAINEVDCKDVFVNFFNANLSNRLFIEILELILSIISIIRWSDEMTLDLISKSKNIIASYHFEKKMLMYEVIKKKIIANLSVLFLLIFDEDLLSSFGDINFCCSIIHQIRKHFPNDKEFEKYFDMYKFNNSINPDQ